jgi:hypothetical protein
MSAPARAAAPHPAGPAPAAPRTDIPRLSFAVSSVRPLERAAVPTLAFGLAVTRSGGGPVRSVLLSTAIRIDAARASYEHADVRALGELFGQPEQWATSLRPLAWTRLTTVVPPFDTHTTLTLEVPCTGDRERALHTYFRALGDADVPLELLLSGTVFHTSADGRLATAQLPWDTETACRLPAALWRELTARYFGPGSWLRLSHGTGERLGAYGMAHGLVDADRTVAALLDAAEGAGPTGAA